ncbi:MAG: 3'-5' exonuclease [Tenacibaculum sp.]
MVYKIELQNILFLDIETVPIHQSWDKVSTVEKELFKLKTKYRQKDGLSPEHLYKSAGIWAEFGKIICISVAYFYLKDKERQLRVTSFYGDDEKEILLDFKQLIEKHFCFKKHILCAHNGKEFDFPFIARRMIMRQIILPNKLSLFGKKPWEVEHLDTLDLWKFGDYKHYTSLNLLAYVLGVPSPKEDIDGSQIAEVYYRQKDIGKIVEYCERDTVTVAQIILRLRGLALIEEKYIVKV